MHVQNSRQFTEEVRKIHLEDDEVLRSLLSLPTSETVKVIQERLMEDETLSERTDLSLAYRDS